MDDGQRKHGKTERLARAVPQDQASPCLVRCLYCVYLAYLTDADDNYSRAMITATASGEKAAMEDSQLSGMILE